MKPKVFFGCVFSRMAISPSPSCVQPDMFLPLGRCCRRSSLVFSLLPRCQGLFGLQKQACTPVSTVKRLWSAISESLSQAGDLFSCAGKCLDVAGEHIADIGRARRFETDERQEAACPLHEGRDLQVDRAQDEVPSQYPGITRFMSKKGCSPDISACEGFFGRLKVEMFYGLSWRG